MNVIIFRLATYPGCAYLPDALHIASGMSKLTQIETEILNIDGAKFQQLWDAYLHRRGYEGINPLGRVIGKDKVARGTPDTWVRQPNGKYVFAEYTTIGTEKLLSKIREDVAKCLDADKTGLPVDKIQELIYCHTSVLSSGEHDAVISEAQAAGILITPIGIGPLAHDLYQKYPGLARDFLGVEVDTGQVLLPEEFVAIYGRHALATPLDTEFYFREGETHNVLEALEHSNIVTLVGRPGVGKSRLALHCSAQFIHKHPEYEIRCVYNRGADLFQDLRVHFAAPGNYLIIVDDADRLLRGFEYVLQLLRDQTNDRIVKLLITVRDYARTKVRDAIRPFAQASEVELEPLGDEQLKQFIEQNYGIRNHHFLTRIATIAQGNPRLAIMAAKVALKEDSLTSIRDVSALYDEYYQSIREYLDAFEDKLLLRVAGVVALLRSVDRTNESQMGRIFSVFQITPPIFWDSVERLHSLELVDIYENEIVKTSDQILATYLFYLAFFRERVLEPASILQGYFPEFRHRVMDALHPIVNGLGNDVAVKRLKSAVAQVWKSAAKAGDRDKLLDLMDCFGPLLPSETLEVLHEWIRDLAPEGQLMSPDLGLNYRNYPSAPRPSILSVLGSLRSVGNGILHIVLELLLEYASKRPSESADVLKVLLEAYGFMHRSGAESYQVEQTVVNAFINRIAEGEEPIINEIFLAASSIFLRTKFESSESDGHTSTIYRFNLTPTDDLFELRRRIWKELLGSRFNSQPARVLSLLKIYVEDRRYETVAEIVSKDATELLPFMVREMNAGEYEHCCIVQDYLNRLERHGIAFPEAYRQKFESRQYNIARLLTREVPRTISFSELEQDTDSGLREYISGFGPEDLDQFLQSALLLLRNESDQSVAYTIRDRLQRTLLLLSENAPDLYCHVVGETLENEKSFNLMDLRLVDRLIELRGIDETERLLLESQHPNRIRTLFDFYRALPSHAITDVRLQHLLALFRVAEGSDLPYDLNFLRNYLHFQPTLFRDVVDVLVRRAEAGANTSASLKWLFNSHNPIWDEFLETFADAGTVLKQGYNHLSCIRENFDYSGKLFNIIMNLDPHFLRERFEYVFASYEPAFKGEGPDADREHRDYNFLWYRDDCESVMEDIARCLFTLERGLVMYRSFFQLFFAVREDEPSTPPNPVIADRQDAFLQRLIRQTARENDFLIWLFDTIGLLSFERQRKLIAEFVSSNGDLDTFTNLRVAPMVGMHSGSFVPLYEKRVEFFESLLPLFNRVQLLKHRRYVERAIEETRLLIEQEKREEFLRR